MKLKSDTVLKDNFDKGHWEKVSESEAQELWNKGVEKIPEFNEQNVHMISGALLPIWGRLPQEKC